MSEKRRVVGERERDDKFEWERIGEVALSRRECRGILIPRKLTQNIFIQFNHTQTQIHKIHPLCSAFCYHGPDSNPEEWGRLLRDEISLGVEKM